MNVRKPASCQCLALVIILALSGFQYSYSQIKIQLLKDNQPITAQLRTYLTTGEIVTFSKANASALFKSKPEQLSFIFRFENKEWEIELKKNDLFTSGFFVSTSSDPDSKIPYSGNILHYRGNIKGRQHSFAAVSIEEGKLVAVIADEKGNINIGAVNTPAAKQLDDHIIYRETALKARPAFSCDAPEPPGGITSPVPVYRQLDITGSTINTEPIDMYFEADYSVYTSNGSNVVSTVNYIASLYNVMQTLYENDSVLTKINSLRIWNTPDPYVNLTSTGQVLSAFSTAMAKGFPGDLAHFLSMRSLGGGIAYLNVLCSGNSSKVAVSANLSNSFNLFPNYSWSVMVIAHETGHNLGSLHTQSCAWPGGPIDNCAPTEGSCADGPAPVNGGTIMSYCHLTQYGINFANGFGSFPGALVRSNVRNNPCLNPAVYFETTFQTVTEEDADSAGECQPYKIVSTVLKMPYAASQPVDISLQPSVAGGLTIGASKDVELSTAGFVLDAAHLSHTISIKVNDDAIVELPESLTLNFNINNNGGNAVKRNNGTFYSLSVLSKDYAPDSLTGQQLYYESFDTVTTGLGGWTQTVVSGTASPNRWIIGGGNAEFTGNAAFISNNKNNNAYSGSSADDATIIRLESPAVNAAGFSNMVLSYLSKCNGEALFTSGGTGGQGQISGRDYGRVYCSINNGASWILMKDNIFDRSRKMQDEITLPPAANRSSNLKIAFEWLNNGDSVNNPPFIIDSIVLRGTTFTPIQSEANPANSADQYIGSGEKIHYYNPATQLIMASIESRSNADAGCTSLSLLSTGTGTLAAWDTATAARIGGKVYQVVPSNLTVPYKLTLYYTKEEIDGWLAETGNTLSDLVIVSTTGNVLNVPVITEPVFSVSNTLTAYSTGEDIAISGIFTGAGSFAIMKSFSPVKCPGNEIVYSSVVKGSAYRWQVNNGSGFINLSNAGAYAATATDTLHITAPPTNWYDYKYRCAVTTATGLVYSPEYTLKLGVNWLGAVSKSWENAANWGCGILPDENVDVTISGGTIFSPEISASASVRSLKINAGASLTIKTGSTLSVKK